MKIAVITYSFARRGTSPADIVRFASEAGLHGIEWYGEHAAHPRQIARLCRDYGVSSVSYTFTLPEIMAGTGAPVNRDALLRHIEIAQQLNTPHVMIHTPNAIEDRDRSRRYWIAALAEAIRYTSEAGLRLSIENFPGCNSPFIHAGDFLEAKREIPDLLLTLDTGNCLPGQDPLACCRACLDSIAHVHCKDLVRQAHAEDGFDRMIDSHYYKTVPLGEGVIDFRGLYGLLRGAGFAGCLMIEYDGTLYGDKELLTRGVAYLRRIEQSA